MCRSAGRAAHRPGVGLYPLRAARARHGRMPGADTPVEGPRGALRPARVARRAAHPGAGAGDARALPHREARRHRPPRRRSGARDQQPGRGGLEQSRLRSREPGAREGATRRCVRGADGRPRRGAPHHGHRPQAAGGDQRWPDGGRQGIPCRRGRGCRRGPRTRRFEARRRARRRGARGPVRARQRGPGPAGARRPGEERRGGDPGGPRASVPPRRRTEWSSV